MFYAKLIISGNVVEFYQGNYMTHLPGEKGSSAFKEKWKEEFLNYEVGQDVRNKSSFYRSKTKAKRIIFCNAWRWYKNNGKPYLPFFLTLTFGENIKNLKTANRIFSKFIQRLNYLIGYEYAHLQYIGIPEFQERGAIHYHVILFNFPYIKNRVYKTIRELWGEGRIDLRKVTSMNTLINYLSKYMVKEAEDGRLAGKKRYFVSKKIQKPLVIDDPYASLVISDKLTNRLIFENEFEAPYIGTVKYKQFVLKEHESILDLDLDQDTKTAILLVIKEPNLRLPL